MKRLNMNIEERVKDMKENPSIQIDMGAEADPKKYKEFFKHECMYTRKDNPVTGAIGGAISYKFTQTTVGTIVKAMCACGKEEDITDYRGW
jgi:hypothetical protein